MSSVTPQLFDVKSVVSERKKARREAIRAFMQKHRIWTYHSTHMRRSELPWNALLMPEGVTEDTAMEHIGQWATRLDDEGTLVCATTKLDAIRELCRLNKIPTDGLPD